MTFDKYIIELYAMLSHNRFMHLGTRHSRSNTEFFFRCNSTTLFECIMYKQQINAHKYIIANNLVVDANALLIIFSVQLFAFYFIFFLKNSVRCNTFAADEQMANVIFIINRLLLAYTVFFRVCKSTTMFRIIREMKRRANFRFHFSSFFHINFCFCLFLVTTETNLLIELILCAPYLVIYLIWKGNENQQN